MKVDIGPYTPWWSSRIYTDYMNKKYNYNNWDTPNNRFEKFLEKIEDFINWVYYNTINRIFSKMDRKVKVKIHDYDIWGMDHTLSYIILPMLKLLKQKKKGAPFVDDEDVPEHLRSTAAEPKENEYDTDSNHFERWDWVLDQMIWSFEQELDENPERHYYDPYLPDEPVEPPSTYSVINADGTVTEETFELETKEWRRKMGKFNHEKRKAYEERKQLGFTLFGKHFQNLWD